MSSKMIIKCFEEEITIDFIKDYNEFIKKCHKEFDMDEDQIKSFKLYKLDDDDKLDIDNENDFKDNIEDGGEIKFIIKTCERKKKKEKASEEVKKDEQSKEEKKDEEKKEEKVEKKEEKKEEEEKKKEEEKKEEQQKLDNKNISSSIQDTGSSKIIETSTNEKFQEEMNKKYEEIKRLITEQNEERKKKEEEMREENKKNLKKSINEVKQFLMTFQEEMKNNNTKMNESMTQLSSIQNNPKEEQVNKKMLDAIIESTNNKSTELESQIKTLVEKIQKISETIENQSKVIVQQNKEEENKFYGCSFVDGNYILNIYHDDLMNMKVLNHDITLINNGTLSWPENAFIYGKSNDNILECKLSVNKNKEIKPNESVNVRVLVNLKNIQNQNNEITLPIKLSFEDQSIKIKQNGFKVIIKVKETKQISMQEPQMTESNIKKIPPNNQSQINNEQTNTNQNKEDKKNKTNKNSTQTPNPNMQNPSSNEVNQSTNKKKNNKLDFDINNNNQNPNNTTNKPAKVIQQVPDENPPEPSLNTSKKPKANTQQQNLISNDMSDDML